MGNILELDHVTEKLSEKGVADGGRIQFAASGMKGWRVTMEDSHTLSSSIPIRGDSPLDDHALFGVYDGHGGDLSSSFLGKNFLKFLSNSPEMKRYAALPKTGNKSREDVTGVELLRNALNSAFRELDSALRKLQSELNQQYLSKEEELQGEQAKDSEDNVSTFRKLERSGSTCCVVVITPSHFICANAGDSRAILRRGGNTLPLSFDHKPPNLPEQERIVSAGGFVKARRVDGDLAVSRGLGDFFFKSQIELPLNKQKVISEPEILVYPRDSVKDEFIAVACDGVWDVVDNNECGAMIQDILDEGETDIVLVCEEVLDSCLEKNSRDNMTLVMVCLPAIRMMKDSGRRSNVVMNRRAARRNRILEAHAKAAAQTTAKTIGLNFNYKGSNQLAQASSEHTSLRLEEKQPQRSD